MKISFYDITRQEKCTVLVSVYIGIYVLITVEHMTLRLSLIICFQYAVKPPEPATVVEQSPPGTLVYTVKACDRDSNPSYSAVRYRFLNNPTNFSYCKYMILCQLHDLWTLNQI